MKNKKILVYSFTFLPNLGGLERNSYTICNTIKNLGYEVTLLTKTQNNEADKYNFTVKRTSSLLSFAKAIFNTDLIIINGGIAKPIAFISLFFKIKYVPLYANAELKFLRGNTLSDQFSKYLFHKAHHHICLSEYTKNQTKKANASVMLNPIDGELEQFVIDNEVINNKFDCLFVGRIIEGKGIFVLVEAIKIIKTKYGKDVSVAFAGEGSDINVLKEFLVQNKLNYTLLGRLDGKNLVNAYKSSKLVLIPSTTHIEGNPLVLAEAISCGTPVIVSDQQAMVETIENAGEFVERGNEKLLAERLYYILNHPIYYQELKKNCLLIRDNFSMKNYTKNFKELLEKIV